eukprot:1884546-Rhodomonas_salina.2
MCEHAEAPLGMVSTDLPSARQVSAHHPQGGKSVLTIPKGASQCSPSPRLHRQAPLKPEA